MIKGGIGKEEELLHKQQQIVKVHAVTSSVQKTPRNNGRLSSRKNSAIHFQKSLYFLGDLLDYILRVAGYRA